MNAERVPQSLQQHSYNSGTTSINPQRSRESSDQSGARARNSCVQQLAEQHGHAYGSITVSGMATAVLGDKIGDEHHHSNTTFHINQAHFVLPNVSAISPSAKETCENQTPTYQTPAGTSDHQELRGNEKDVYDPIGVWLVPFERTEALVGRSKEVETLIKCIDKSDSNNRVAITGLGGVGKSRLALEVTCTIRQQQPYCSIFWIQCSNLTSFERDCRGMAKALNIPAAYDPRIDIKSVLKTLAQVVSGRWLIVLDNADDEDLWSDSLSEAGNTAALLKYIPRSQHGFVLVTTRSHKIAVKIARQNVVRLNDLTQEDASAMLMGLLIRPQLLADSVVTSRLLGRVSCLPLALVQAAAYINENDLYSIQDYLQIWDSTEEDIVKLLSEGFEDSNRYAEASNPVTLTWLISFDQIRRRDELAAAILSCMACLDSQSIPRSALPIQASPLECSKAFGMLTGYALVQPQPSKGTDVYYDMHRLVHLATRNWLRKQGTFLHWLQSTAEHMYEICPWDRERNDLIHYLPHAEKLCASPEIQDDFVCIKLMDKLAACFKHTTQLVKAIELLRHALRWRERHESPEAIDTIECSVRLGWALHNHGKLKDAQELLEPAVESLETRLGKEDARVLDAKRRLGPLYLRQGRLQEAETISREVMETSQKVMGPADNLTLTAMRDLALVYRDQWSLDRAEQLLLDLIKFSKQAYGKNDLRASRYNGDLALILSRRGRSEEAIELLESLLRTNSDALGDEHAGTLQCMFDLAIMYRNSKRLSEAESLFLKEIAIEERLKGEDDFDLIMTKSSLAKTYFAQGRYKEAGELQEYLIKKGLSLYNQVNPSILLFKSDLANTYWEVGRKEEALEVLCDCLAQSEGILGVDHKMTIERREKLKAWTSTLADLGSNQSGNACCSNENIYGEGSRSNSGKTKSHPAVVEPRRCIVRKRSSSDGHTTKKQKV